MTTLLPCPFCGSDADYYPGTKAAFKTTFVTHVVRCVCCRAQVQTVISRDAVVGMWNTRWAATFPSAGREAESDEDVGGPST